MQVELLDNKTYYMDGYLKSNLDIAKTVIKKDWDFVFLIDGTEGGGKSLLAFQMAKYCDPKFDLDKIAFTPEEFKDTILKSSQYEAVVYDEAYTGLSSRGAMTDINRILVSMLAEIRQKNLFVFIVMPTFFDLDKYAALWRSRALIHIYTDDNWDRGYFTFYNADRKKQLYILGKKFYNYKCVKSNFFGRFTNAWVVDELEYRKKKLEALSARKTKKDVKDTERLNIALKVLCNYISTRRAAKELTEAGLEISQSYIVQLIGRLSDESLKD